MNRINRILLAEDNPSDLELTLAALAEQKLGDQVTVVADGAEALDFLYFRGRFKLRAEGNPVVIVLDLKMPKVDGLEVLRAVKQDANLRKIPVVMLTSSREERDLARSYDLGANAYVVKPTDFQALVNVVKNVAVFWAVNNEPPPGSVRVALS